MSDLFFVFISYFYEKLLCFYIYLHFYSGLDRRALQLNNIYFWKYIKVYDIEAKTFISAFH